MSSHLNSSELPRSTNIQTVWVEQQTEIFPKTTDYGVQSVQYMTLVWSNLRIPRNSIFHLTPQQTQHDLVISNYIIRRLLDKFYSLNDASYCTTSKHPTVNKYWTSFQLYQNKEMGKISKTLLNTLLISTALANENQDTDEQPPYSVIGCNEESTPVSCP